MNVQEVYALEEQIEQMKDALRKAEESLAEERRERASCDEILWLVRTTRGGSRAWLYGHSLSDRELNERGGRTSYGWSEYANGSGFHWRGGIYFSRRMGGTVVIQDWRRIFTDDGEIRWTGHDFAVIDPDSWASIVASVSATGETTETYQATRAFHAATPSSDREPER